MKTENSLFDGRVVLRRAFNNNSRCRVEKIEILKEVSKEFAEQLPPQFPHTPAVR